MNISKRCDGLTRRNFVRVGGLTALGLGMPGFFELQRATAGNAMTRLPSFPRAKSCILIWLDGGASHLDTFDPKPQAPSEVRGPFGSIGTKLTGIRISEHMPETAKILDKLALIRSVTSPFGVHNFAVQYLMTGYQPTPAIEYPVMASVVAQLKGQDGVLPSNIAIQRVRTAGVSRTHCDHLQRMANIITMVNKILRQSFQQFRVGCRVR